MGIDRTLSTKVVERKQDWRTEVGSSHSDRSADLARAREPGRGRGANTPEQIPPRGWKDIFWRVLGSISENRILSTSGSVAFFALLTTYQEKIIEAAIQSTAPRMLPHVTQRQRASLDSYNRTYGSLGAGIGFMVWLWISAAIVLLGGQLNAEMEHQTARDTTEGRSKPLGARGAMMADRVGKSHH